MQAGQKSCIVIVIIMVLIALVIFIFSSCFQKIQGKSFAYVKLGADDTVGFAGLSQDQQAIYYYSAGDSEIKKYLLENKTTSSIAKVDLSDVSNVVFAPNFSRAVIQTFNSSSGIASTSLYDLSGNNKKLLSANIGNVAWSPNSDKVAYYYDDWDRSINDIRVASANFDGERKVADINSAFETANLGWLSENEIYYYPIPYEEASVPIAKINVSTLQTTNLNKGNTYSGIKFFGDQGVATTVDSAAKSTGISVVDLSGNLVKKLNQQTSLDKVLLSGSTLFAAVSDQNGDTLISVDLANDTEKALVSSSSSLKLQVKSMFLGEQGNIFYLINDKYLYRVSL